MRFARLLIDQRRAVWFGLALVTLGLGVVATGLQYDFSPQALYAKDDDDIAYAEAFGDDFGHEDAVVLVVLEAVGNDDVLAPAALTWLRTAGRDLEALPVVQGVESAATLQVPRVLANGEPGLAPVPLLEGDVTPQDAARVRTVLDRQPLADGVLVDRERRLAALLVAIDPDLRLAAKMSAALASVRTVLDAHPPPSGYRIRLSGMPVLRNDVVADLETEQVHMLPVVACVFFLVMWLAFRRLFVAILPLAAVGVGVIWMTGSMVLLGQDANIIGHIIPILLFAIGTANGVHILNRYGEEVSRTPADRPGALVRTLTHMGPACFLTFCTTAIGFLSLTTARFYVLQAVGLQTALGLGLLYVSTMLILGTLLHRTVPAGALTPTTPRRSIGALLSGVGGTVARHPWIVLSISLFLLGGSALLARDMDVNSRILETYDGDHPLTQTMELVESRLGGVLIVDVSLQAEDDDRLLDPAICRKVDEAAQWARGRPEVLRVCSYVDIHKAILRYLPGGASPANATPGQVRTADAVARRLNAVVHYDRFFAPDAKRARLMLQVEDVGTRRLLALTDALEAELARLELGPDGVDTRLTGVGMSYAHSVDGFIHDVLNSLYFAAAVIFTIIALLFRSLRFGLVSILPNITPLVLTLGYMALRGYELNASNVIVFAIGLGVAVDNTIHFLARFREERRVADTTHAAIRRTLKGAGRAMVLTTLLMILGLLFLYTSQFVPTRRFAELTSVMMIAALIGDLCLLPACLVLFTSKKPAAGAGQARSANPA